MVEEFRKRRDAIIDGLNGLPGVTCLKPKGAFYVFPNINSEEFVELMLTQAELL